ncbi:invertase inhibitor [Canna indica]|uniref:Invertase inhibitor n=1 Tax=Canna indica TaxID=4628 RepID=A0AAQ3KIN9_9LILI|nr:invertase inhibitor [Canna indica]
MMTGPSVFLSLLLLVFVSSFDSVASSAMDDACMYLGDSYITPEFCKGILSTDPRSKTAPDVHTICAISVDIVVARGAAMAAQFKDQAAAAGDAFAKRKVEVAQEIFDDDAASFKWASGSVAAKYYRSAGKIMNVARDSYLALESLAKPGKAGAEYFDALMLADAMLGHQSQ